MESHVKVLGILHVAMGSLGVLAAILVAFITGGITSIVGTTGHAPEAAAAAPIIGSIGGIVVIVILIFALPGLIGGVGLLMFAPWSRVYMIVISALHLLHIPLGTALGIYGLWVLTKPETEALLSGRRYQTASY